MKSPITRIYIRLLLTATLSTISLPVLQAEAHCPGSVASVTPRFVQRALIVIPVKIDQKGPFDFMVDTGSQITVIDPSLAAELNLKSQGSVGLVTVASHLQASVAELDTLEADSHVVAKPVVVVQDLGQIQAADRRIRGVLGENFLSHFDVLIDYGHKLLCLDETKLMQQNIRGEHVPFVRSQGAEDEAQFTERLDISVRLSGTGARQIVLQLDSGSDGPILYPGMKEKEPSLLKQASLQTGNVSKAQQAFALLPPQDMRIGNHTFNQVQFVTPAGTDSGAPQHEEDGLLPTVLFERIFICHADHYVVFDPQ